MKVHSASIALLGLPSALAAVAATFNNAAPTRPDPAVGLPQPSPQPAAFGDLEQETRQEVTVEDNEQREEEQSWHELLRRAAEAEPSPTVHNTFTHVNTTTATITNAPAGTEVAVFTAAGAIFTVTEISGNAAVDGKSLVPGGPAQLIGGEYISEGSKGQVVANGQTLSFEAFSSSSKAPSERPAGSTSATASSSSGAAGGQGGSSSSSGGAGPVQTAANVVAIVGAVVGVLVL